MTWTKLSDTFTDDPVLLRLPRSTRLMHVEALVYCNRLLTDGVITRAALRRCTDHDDPEAGARQLLEAGLWREHGDGWVIVDFTRDQPSRADVERNREAGRVRQERLRRHRAGDHSLCLSTACHAVTPGVTDGVGNTTPSRPVPTRQGRDGTDAAAPPLDAADAAGEASHAGVAAAVARDYGVDQDQAQRFTEQTLARALGPVQYPLAYVDKAAQRAGLGSPHRGPLKHALEAVQPLAPGIPQRQPEGRPEVGIDRACHAVPLGPPGAELLVESGGRDRYWTLLWPRSTGAHASPHHVGRVGSLDVLNGPLTSTGLQELATLAQQLASAQQAVSA